MFRIYIGKIENVWYSVVLSEDNRIVTCNFSLDGRKNAITNVLYYLSENASFTEATSEDRALVVTKNMHRIYEGKNMEHEFKLDMDRLPLFTRKVLLITSMIPRGFVSTYSGIANALGKKSAARAVGNAEASNPYTLIVPCHRVVCSNLELGGYGGGSNLKREILIREGVVFKRNKISKLNLYIPKKVS